MRQNFIIGIKKIRKSENEKLNPAGGPVAVDIGSINALWAAERVAIVCVTLRFQHVTKSEA